ncbi:ABC transporter permease [Oceanicella actignis]|uniref:ABC transporter permease n=1 Tax=Oceanicella actignis TaxID=1189325 RepID=UPI0011E7423F|nr:ABC transporter permease [Oceanicella actignis]TYO90444.1 NitT/TauT family transport system permease protein [Oceanicella actignis]
MSEPACAHAREGARPVPYRGGGFAPRPRRWAGAAFLAGLIAFWEMCSRLGWISPLALPAPSEALAALRDLAQSGLLAKHLGASLGRLAQGWTLGVLAGIAAGLAAGLFSLARAGILPLVAALFPIPKIALLPLFIIWFGIGEESKVATILFGTFFPMTIAVYGGVDNVDRTLIRMGQSFGLSRLSIIRKIVLPGAMPAILSGMRISASIAIILLVAAEMIGAEYGVGAYILLAGNLMATDQLVAGVMILSAMGLTVSWLLGMAERRLLRWRA